jgi:hypothetical protein
MKLLPIRGYSAKWILLRVNRNFREAEQREGVDTVQYLRAEIFIIEPSSRNACGSGDLQRRLMSRVRWISSASHDILPLGATRNKFPLHIAQKVIALQQ